MVEQFTGKTSCSIVTSVKAVSSLTGVNGHGDLRQRCRTVVVNNYVAIFFDCVISVFLFVHIKIVLSVLWWHVPNLGTCRMGMKTNRRE